MNLRFTEQQKLHIFLLLTLYIQPMATWASDEPKVMTDLNKNGFEFQCETHVANGALDDNGLLSVSVWNIYKQNKPQWDKQLSILTHASQLVLLQEAGLTQGLKTFITDASLEVAMAQAFTLWDVAYGVMNLSRVPATHVCAYTANEPIIRFAKSGMASFYPLSNGSRLLVINLHGINFEWNLTSYKRQLALLVDEIDQHTGPIILAGDFNTWREERMKVVTQFAERFNLTAAKYDIDKRERVFGYPLDHLFYRGLTLHTAQSHETVSSDHNPITASFTLND